MKKLLLVLDDETANLLAGKKNKSKFVRESIRYMSMDISTDTIDGMRKSYKAIAHKLGDMDGKLDYIAKEVQK